ncbi:MAG: hypothetical protein ACRC5T_10625 [Cetobacterium sp.]
MFKVGDEVVLCDMTNEEFIEFEELCSDWKGWLDDCWLNGYVGKIVEKERKLYYVKFKYNSYIWLTEASLSKYSRKDNLIKTVVSCVKCKHYSGKRRYCLKLSTLVKKTNICDNLEVFNI